ncbi:MAG: Gfo/Idh/MocA family oxidoreductase [Planctomycetota bacterium]|nr:Gfo/Idh/MocA family oxidoreductase [Planctomycetota bacterium]
MSDSHPTRIALLGTGDVSDLHAEAIHEYTGATLHGVWNRTPEKGQAKALKFGCEYFDSAESLVRDPAIDAVFVLTNMETHLRYAEMALQAGKHVLVEKPTASSVDEIKSMQAAADTADKICMPVHNYIYEASLTRTRNLIDSGKLGDLVTIYVMYNIHHPEVVAARYPGVIRQILTHHSYILLYLAGQPKSVFAMKSTINDGSVPQENLAMATLEMENGALAHLCASFASDDHAGDPWTCMIKVIGTKGATRFSYRDWVENTPAVVHSQTYSVYPDSIKNTVHYFLGDCIQQGLQPLSSLNDAITCQRMIEGCEAAVTERRVIDLPHHD